MGSFGGTQNKRSGKQSEMYRGGDERKQHENVKLKEEDVPILPLS